MKVRGNISKKFNGVVLMKNKSDETYLVQGYDNFKEEKELKRDSQFYICSISKMFVAVAINQLVDRKLLSKTDSVSKYLGEYIKDDNITIYNLLTHTSGLSNYIMYRKDLDWKKQYTTKQILDVVLSKKARFKAGEKWSYSNTGYYLLTLILEKVTGMTYEEYIKEYILNPLKMENTGFSDEEKMNSVLPNIKNKQGYVIHPTLLKGAGDIISTVDDLYIFGEALYQGKLISKERAREMIQPVFGDMKVKYGEGMFINEHFGEVAIGHSGSMPTGYSTQLNIYPSRGQVNVVLSNNRICLNPWVYPDANGKYIESALMEQALGQRISVIKKAYI